MLMQLLILSAFAQVLLLVLSRNEHFLLRQNEEKAFARFKRGVLPATISILISATIWIVWLAKAMPVARDLSSLLAESILGPSAPAQGRAELEAGW